MIGNKPIFKIFVLFYEIWYFWCVFAILATFFGHFRPFLAPFGQGYQIFGILLYMSPFTQYKSLQRQKKTAEAHVKYETGQETTKHPTTLTPVLPLSSRHT